MKDLFDDISMREASDRYWKFLLDAFEGAGRNRSKAIGQFATPSEIYSPMLEDLVNGLGEVGEKLRIVDPFCGDGRLLFALLSLLSSGFDGLEEVEVVGWDTDESILEKAMAAQDELNDAMPFGVKAVFSCRDAFMCGAGELASFDICVTNPPWSSAKSLKRSCFADESSYSEYLDVVSRYASQLASRFPEAKGKAFGPGSINLSRFGMKLAVDLVKPGGSLGIVMPSSFLADTASSNLRSFAFTECRLDSVHYFPAELRLFGEADQAGVALLLAKGGEARTGKVFSHASNDAFEYALDDAFWEYSSANGYSVPVDYSDDEMALIEKLYKNPSLEKCADIHLGREVDETRIGERLCEKSDYRFVKGFMVHGYGISSRDVWYFDDSAAQPPSSANEEKVVWRDVSRVSQKKRVQGTLLPPGHVAGNSLGVATSADGRKLRAFLGVLNSSIFEFAARSVLTTNHVSVGALRRIPYPSMSNAQVEALANAVDELLQSPTSVETYRLIDGLVADCYGLTDDEYGMLRPLGLWSDCSVGVAEASR